jgi:hypothetical protein
MKTRGKPFRPGNSGKPKGARHKATVAIENLLEGEAEGIGRKCCDMALAGDAAALRLAMERIAPVRKARVRFNIPAVLTIGDLPGAIAAVVAAVADGTLSPEEGSAMAGTLSAQRQMLETCELEKRIAALEAKS